MLAYLFPPDSGSGSFRPMHFARHLQELGEEICVLTAREEDYMPYQTKDPRLLEEVPAGVTIFRSRVFRPGEAVIEFRNRLFRRTPGTEEAAVPFDSHGVTAPANLSWFHQLKDTVTNFLTTPDPEIGWLPSAVKEGLKIIKTRNIDVIYVTAAPWTSLLIAALLKRFTGKPLVMDFRDPWVTNPVFQLKTKASQRIEAFLERQVLPWADRIVANTDELKQDFLRRFPSLAEDTLTTITNGFEAYRARPEQRNERLTLTHAGTMIFRNPRFLLQAVMNSIEQERLRPEELRIVFLGGITSEEPALKALLQHPRLRQVVEILPRRPYQEALDDQNRSDVLFLMQPDEFPLQVPRKLYEYIAFRKPILGITPPDSATGKIIRENNLGIAVNDHPAEIEAALQALYAQWKKGDLSLLSTDKCDQFMNTHLTLKLQKVLGEALANR